MVLSNKIREFRFNCGEMTQKRLSELVGVSRQTMSAIENRRYAPTVDVAMRIAGVFGITVDELFDLDDVARPSHRQMEPTMPVAQSENTVQESVPVEDDNEPAEEPARNEISLASLRRIIGCSRVPVLISRSIRTVMRRQGGLPKGHELFNLHVTLHACRVTTRAQRCSDAAC